MTQLFSQPAELRRAIRAGDFAANTSGQAPGFVQCNLAILPKDWAAEFLQFCQKNPKPCPLIAMSDEPGNPLMSAAGVDVDIRTDLPRYRLWRNGELAGEVGDVREHWQDDLVTFLIGCSFSFEEALLADGLDIRNISEGVNVPMFNTNLACAPAGRFSGNLVVSMRPFVPADAIRMIQICSRFPSVHGAPIHFGDPAAIGIADLHAPDYGDAVTIKAGEVPVFTACGVTPQAAIMQAKPPFCITHSPGCMLVTDIPNAKLAIL
ncbi:putative hydro-lyase [Simiduia sp. 21SJ11W-1]|uniref:putative hydro-lyase n=1 Tax=Simiduia sp. 21SJ11W-1 TaxID=2909669 RepID=UPI0020A18C81|nr:putative hydro-lyase [Simiduia sp. 21SJ11W-1]UTA47831.1 putative hydro-lyase [Simiduia sp. 21SJ11W-1]